MARSKGSKSRGIRAASSPLLVLAAVVASGGGALLLIARDNPFLELGAVAYTLLAVGSFAVAVLGVLAALAVGSGRRWARIPAVLFLLLAALAVLATSVTLWDVPGETGWRWPAGGAALAAAYLLLAARVVLLLRR